MSFTGSRLWVASIAAACLMPPAVVFAQGSCAPLPLPAGNIIEVSPAQAASLPSIVLAARPGDTIQLTDGVYVLPQTLYFQQPGVTIRSKTGNRTAVTLDGQYAVGDILLLTASNLTVADLTVTRAYYHPVHVAPEQGTTTGTLIHNVRVVDGAQQFIKINQNNGYADNGIVRCSSLEMTDAGRAHVRDNCYTGGIDAHLAQGWQVSLNVFSGFWCSAGLSEHAIHFWMSSRDTTIDRNVIMNSARGVGLGLAESWPVVRTYPDQPCGGKTAVGHYGGSITNTVIFANDPRLFASVYGFDAGISLEQACGASVLHNTVFSTAPPYSSIEWRWSNTLATIANNIVSHNLQPRDGGVATLGGNLTNAPPSLFIDAVTSGDLHLRPTATAAIDQGVTLTSPVAWDIDGAPRGSRPDIGADELQDGTPSPSSGQSLLVNQTPGSVNNVGANFELGMRFWSDTAGRLTAIRFWKAAGEGGVHVGRIWTSSGQALATVTFANESPAGWQQQELSVPLEISANTEYVVSVNTTANLFPATTSFFISERTSGNLHAPAGANGLYSAAQAVGTFPSNPYASTNYFRDIVFVAGAGSSASAPETLLTTQVPAGQNFGTGANFELGTRFTSDIAGRVTAIRFWKAPGESGEHVGRLWSAAGQLLASATFANESASGWQEQVLATDVPISPNAEYVVSVNTTNALFVATMYAFVNELVGGHLRAPGGANGVYGPPHLVGTFPNASFASTNYFRDVRFVPSR